MFMTVLRADFDTLQTREYMLDLNDGYFMHRWLTSQTHTDRKTENILYRLDRTDDAVFMYIQSDHEFPEKNIKRAGMEKLRSFEIKKPEGVIRFKIACNPNRTIKDSKTLKSKKVFLKDQDERIDWLKKKLSPFMSDIQIMETNTSKIMGKNNSKMGCSEFIGIGRITDPDNGFDTIRAGIGKGKSFGLGLMLFQEIEA